MFGFVRASEFESVDFRDPQNCQRCAYFEDCRAYWRFCPYTGEPSKLRRADVEILDGDA